MRHSLSACVRMFGCCALLTSCALLSKSAPHTPRYFTPLYQDTASTAHSGKPGQSALRLRLGRVSATSNLRERIAYRTSEQEIRYYANRRWTSQPEAYLKQALSRALFERHGLTMVVSGSAPTLQVELTAFEEIMEAPHRVRAEVTMVLLDDTVARVHETIRVEEQVADAEKDKGPEAVVQALSRALEAVVERVTVRSIAALSQLEELSAAEASPSQEPALPNGSAR